MNEIVRKAETKSTCNNSSVSVELIVAVQSAFAREKTYWVSSRLYECLIQPTDRISEGHLRDTLAEGEAMLSNEHFQRLHTALKSVSVPATIAEIKRELGLLLLAFPTRDDLSAFVKIAVAEIACEPVSRLRLAAACRKLRRSARFRPSIAEILDALSEVDLSHVGSLLKLPEYMEGVRQRLAKGNFRRPVQARIAHGWLTDDDCTDPR
jgi:hypothetical protein